MASVLFREAFAFKDVAQVAAAVGADYLRAIPIRIGMAFNASAAHVYRAIRCETALATG